MLMRIRLRNLFPRIQRSHKECRHASVDYDHIPLRTRDPSGTAAYDEKMFDARIVESVQPDGESQIDGDINGLMVFLAPVPAEATPRVASRST